MASKSDFDTFLAPFWVAFGGILEDYGRHSGDFLGTFFQGLFFDGFLCLRAVSRRLRESPGEGPLFGGVNPFLGPQGRGLEAGRLGRKD